MALLNIGAGNKDDAFYRYKMPKMITKFEGRGNGIKTNVVNMIDIAKALARPASYTTKYFGCELGAQSKFDEKSGTSHVNGAHDTAKLAGLLENFIKKFVQCYGCGNPETEIMITKSQMINMKCAACGFLSEVDMRDKLTTFILKNPPEVKKGTNDKKAMRRAEKERLKEGDAADEELRKLKKEATKKKGSCGNLKETSNRKKSRNSDEEHSPSYIHEDENDIAVPAADYSDDDIQWQTDTFAAAAKQRIQEQLNAITASMVMLSPNEETTKSGQNSPGWNGKPKVNGLDSYVENMTSHQKLVNSMKEFLKKAPTASELKPFLESLSGSAQDVTDALFESLFDGVGKGFSKEIMKKKNYLATVIQEEGSKLILLHAIERFCGNATPAALKEVGLVLKGLYDNGVLEEEFIVEWYENGLHGDNKDSPIWKNAKSFVEWLQSAESESE